MVDQNFEIRIVIFENFLNFSKMRRAVSLQPIWTIMVAVKLDQSRVLVTKFHQNRLTLKGRNAGQTHTHTHTDRQTDRTNSAENKGPSGKQSGQQFALRVDGLLYLHRNTSTLHCVSKKRPTFTTCCYFYIHSSTSTIFGTNVAEKSGNQNLIYNFR